MAGIRIPQLTLDQAAQPAPRPTVYAPQDTTESVAGSTAIAQGQQQFAAGLDKAANHLTELALDAKKQHDEAVVLGADAQFGDMVQGLLRDPTLGEKGAQKGFLYARGDAALGGSDRVLKEYDRRAGELIQSLTDEDQKRAAAKAAQNRRENLAIAAVSHEGEQIQAAGAGKFSASLSTNVSQAGLLWQDPRRVINERELGLAAIERWGKLPANGWSDEQLTKAKRDFNTAIAETAINNAVGAGRGTYAKGLLSLFVPPTPQGGTPSATMFDGTKLDELTKKVRAASVQEEALAAAEKLRSDLPRDIGAQVARAVTENAKSPEVANAIVSHLVQRNAIDDKADADKVAGAKSQFYRWWIASGEPGNRADPSTAPAGLLAATRDGDAIHGAPEFYAQMEGLHRADKAQAYGATPSVAQSRYDALLMVDMVKNPGKYASMSPEQFAAQSASLLTPAQFDAAARVHTSMVSAMQANGNIALPPKVEQLVLKLGKDGGLIRTDDPKLMSVQDVTNMATVRDAIRLREQTWRLSPEGKGKGEPPEAKYLEWLNEQILQKGAVQGGGRVFGDANNVTRAEAATNPRFAGKSFVIEDVKQIPKSDLAGIEAAAARAGVKLTDKERLQKYNQLLQLRAQPPPPPAVTGGGLP